MVSKLIQLLPPIIQKVEKILNLKKTSDYAVGSSLTLADLVIFKFSQLAKDSTFNKYEDVKGRL